MYRIEVTLQEFRKQIKAIEEGLDPQTGKFSKARVDEQGQKFDELTELDGEVRWVIEKFREIMLRKLFEEFNNLKEKIGVGDIKNIKVTLEEFAKQIKSVEEGLDPQTGKFSKNIIYGALLLLKRRKEKCFEGVVPVANEEVRKEVIDMLKDLVRRHFQK